MLLLVSRTDVEVASLRRRAVAGALDLLVVLAVFGAWLVTLVWRVRRRSNETASRGIEESSPRGSVTKFVQSRLGRRMLRVASLALNGTPLRNWRGVGARVAGIQVVDAQSGGPVTIRSAAVGAMVDAVWRLLIGRLRAPLKARSDAARAQRLALEPQLTELLRPHAGDHAQQMKIREVFYKTHGIRSVDGSEALWGMAGALLMALTALLSPRRQTIRQRLAGTLVIRTR